MRSVDLRELGIGIVPYSPIARGFFGGRGVTEQVSAESNLVQIQPVTFYSGQLFSVTSSQKIYFFSNLGLNLYTIFLFFRKDIHGFQQKIWRRTRFFI
jgi:hypothetical protein